VSSEPSIITSSPVTTPRDFLGFAIGDDHRLADWPQVAEYMHLLDRESDRVSTVEIGKTTEGNPFLLTFISSPANIVNLETHKQTRQRLSDPRTISEDDADELISDSPAIVTITCSIHATEVGGTQMSIDLAYQLASSNSSRIRRILDNVILILVPSLNPDGLIKVKRWYDGTRDTHYEGSIPPILYHKYTGHDNNRDWFMFTQIETRLMVEHVHNQWRPHITYDIHQTRSDGMRMILPPFVDPVGPNIDPILQSELAALGTHMASELTAAGKAGVAVNVVYDSYSPSRSYPHYHGGIRVLSEAASVRIASPISVDKTQLKSDRGERPRSKSWNHPMPWSGGQWSLKDIVEYDLIASLACLDNAARNRDTWVRNSFDVLRRAVTQQGNPYAFVIPKEQHDAGSAQELIDVLKFAEVEIHELTEDTQHEGHSLRSGDQLVLTLQPFGNFAQTMLETQRYPDIRHYPGGPPKQPYDSTAHSLPLTMGVTTYELKGQMDTPPNKISHERVSPKAEPNDLQKGTSYAIDPRANDAFKLVNRLLASGVHVSRTSEVSSIGDSSLQAGSFLIQSTSETDEILRDSRSSIHAEIAGISLTSETSGKRLRIPRVGVYQSYVPSTEEGWTRFVLDQYEFQHEPIWEWAVRETDLPRRFDVIVIPHQTVRQIQRGFNSATYSKRYSGGLGDVGVEKLLDFANSGGTLIVWDGSARWATRHFDLPVVNVLAGLTNSDFFSPGSLLDIRINTDHPIGYGMPENAAALFMNGPAWRLKQGQSIAEFSEEKPLLSGLLIGSDKIAGTTALATVPMGRGQIIMFGFRPHFRAQARGTYKLFFNSIYSSVFD
jgi:hypothetical protein